MTRARERLVLSGAAKLDGFAEGNPRRAGGGPIAWIAPAFVTDLPAVIADGGGAVACGEGTIAVTLRRPDAGEAPGVAAPAGEPPRPTSLGEGEPATDPGPAAPELVPGPPRAGSPVATLSYSALADHHRCGYRFYAERVLGLPPAPDEPTAATSPATAHDGRRRGVLVHALLERLDFRRPVAPGPDVARAAATRAGLEPPPGPEELDGLAGVVRAFASSELCARLAAAAEVRRELRFAFPLSDDPAQPMVVGALDVLARERTPAGPGRLLVVDYKTDRLAGASPEAVVRRAYRDQQLVYALAALHAGGEEVQVIHCFLEAPDRPVLAGYDRAQLGELTLQLQGLSAGILQRRFPVAPDPHRRLCAGCPAEGGLCSWPLELTRRESADTLF